jgi:hypothetical protein
MLPLCRRVLASLLLTSALLLPAPTAVLAAAAGGARPSQAAQIRTVQSAALALHAYRFKHQKASAAVDLVHPLLTPAGTVELQPAGNVLVIRDTPEALARILQVLRDFDQPARPLRLELLVVRASRAVVSPPVQRSDLPEELTRRLRSLLPYDSYELEAQAQLATQERESAAFEMGDDFRVSFQLGTVQQDGRVKLSSFQLARKGARKTDPSLIHTNLNLWLDKTVSLGLAKSEASREALMLVLTLRRDDARRSMRP